MSKTLIKTTPFHSFLTANWPSVSDNGTDLQEVPIAVTGTWHRGGTTFSITPEDFTSMVTNFSKRPNGQVVVDFEHASENPAVSKGGPIPAAGWIKDLQVAGNQLIAKIEWTPRAKELIQGGEYRFFSPAISWVHEDKIEGGSQGATLTSGALTNHPFLEELSPILMSEVSSELMDVDAVHIPAVAKIEETVPPASTEASTISVAVDQPSAEVSKSTDTTLASEKIDSPVSAQPQAVEPLADNTASVGGDQVAREHFLYVGDPDKKDTWKLPVHDKNHAQNALARFNQAELPADKKHEVAAKLVRAAKKFGIDTGGFEKEHLSEHPSGCLCDTEMKMSAKFEKIKDGKFAGRSCYTDADGKKHLVPKELTDAQLAEFSQELDDWKLPTDDHVQPRAGNPEKEAIVEPAGGLLADKNAEAALADKAPKAATPPPADDDEPAPASVAAKDKKKLSDTEVISKITDARGRIQLSAVATLVESGEVSAAVVFRAQAAEQAVDAAITAQKYLPKQRPALLKFALSDPTGFAALVNSQPSIKLTTVAGANLENENTPAGDLESRTKQLLSDHKSDANYTYADALREATKENPEAWTSTHRQ